VSKVTGIDLPAILNPDGGNFHGSLNVGIQNSKKNLLLLWIPASHPWLHSSLSLYAKHCFNISL
jgi:hypothetical protein